MTETPVQKALTKFAGKNIYGKPTWRVVLAQEQLVKRGGVFCEYGEGELRTVKYEPVEEKLPNGKTRFYYRAIPVPCSPNSRRQGVFDVPKYPVKGWILERWMPPHVFGDKATWEAQKGQDGVTPLFGDFPSQGDYWMLGGPWEHVPDLGDLQNAISLWEYQFARRPKATAAWFEQQLKEEQRREQEHYEKLEKQLAEYCKSEISPIFKTVSLEAQRVRNDVQKSLGLSSHLGAGQQ